MLVDRMDNAADDLYAGDPASTVPSATAGGWKCGLGQDVQGVRSSAR